MRLLRLSVIVALVLAVSCGGAAVEDGLFFPTWDPGDGAPTGIVQGVLVEDDHCLFVDASGRRTLVVWEDGMGFDDGALLDAGGTAIARLGETIHGGGGYFSSRPHFEDLADELIPERCIPEGNGDRFALSYEVVAGPFE